MEIVKEKKEKFDYEKREEIMKKQREKEREEMYARNFMRQYERRQELRRRHPWNTLDYV